MRLPRSLAAVAALLLGGCATPPADTAAPPDLSFAERELQLRAVPSWEMRGRIAVDTGSDAWQGRFTWWQDTDALRVFIRGPLNTRPVEISGNGDALTVRVQRETRILDDPESQLSELLGWWLPITSLPNWLLGLPDDRYPAATMVLANARLSTLAQRAWQLEYGEYAHQDFAQIPASIRLTNAPLELIVTIDAWNPLSSATP
ncbi:MAG: lipoprotein insertase outer membrane protein LolB [Gammaproteobacteria bacterium]|jgi:outer membrane lipoprotein LolB